MKPRTKVIVCRKWAQPEIEAYLFSDSVGARMELDEFISALVDDVGSPLLLFTKEQLKAAIMESAENIVCEMKEATKHVV